MVDFSKAYLVVPTYNEVDNIGRLTEKILATVPGLHVCVVDDNSPDGTGRLADKLVAIHDRVHVVHRPGKLGLGTAYVAGWRHCMERGAEVLLSMDADFSHKPEHIPGMLEMIDDADLVIGSRYIAGGGIVNFTWDRHVISTGAQLFTHHVLGLNARDCTSGFRCYRKEVLDEIGLDTIKSTGYSFLIEILYRIEKLGRRVGEFPIVYLGREHGISKINRTEIEGAFKTVWRLKWEEITGKRPAVSKSQT